MQGQLTAVIAPAEEGGYYAYCLEVPAVGEGKTTEACREKRTRHKSFGEKWWSAAAVLPGQLIIAFGMFGVVALPNIITAFGTDVQTVQWVMTGYLVARVVPMPAMGWLVSQLGQRNLYVLGILGPTVTTMLCGLSWSMESLIVFRALQGAVGASVMSIGMVMLYEAFPPEQRGLAMGLFIADQLHVSANYLLGREESLT